MVGMEIGGFILFGFFVMPFMDFFHVRVPDVMFAAIHTPDPPTLGVVGPGFFSVPASLLRRFCLKVPPITLH